MKRPTTKVFVLVSMWLAQACAIEPAGPAEPVAPEPAAALTVQAPAAKIKGNRALLITVPAPLGTTTDMDRLRLAVEKMPGKFVVATVNPVSASDVARAVATAAQETAPDGTLMVVLTGFANDKGVVTMPDGSPFGYANLLDAVGAPIQPFKTLAMIVAASQGDNWVRKSQALDHARNFSSSVIATTIPRLSGEVGGEPGAALDEMKLELLHPAASRFFAVLRRSLETQSMTLENALAAMQRTHEQLYGPGPIVEVRGTN